MVRFRIPPSWFGGVVAPLAVALTPFGVLRGSPLWSLAAGTHLFRESCIPCLFRIDPAQRSRLEDNLLAHIAVAEGEGWTGVAENFRRNVLSN
jgi:hypothetical protein